jgi:Tetraspanin family.
VAVTHTVFNRYSRPISCHYLVYSICQQLTGIAILAVGIWMVVELYKYMELSTEFSAPAPYVLIGTGALIILVGSLACCCTVKGQPVLLYIVSNKTQSHA